MKRWLVGIMLFVLLLIACIYIFVPGKLNVSKVTFVNCSIDGTGRFLLKQDNWKKWWPVTASESAVDSSFTNGVFSFKKYTYKITRILRNTVDILISHKNTQINSTIDILPLAGDSAALEWHFTVPSSTNPVKRIQQYQLALDMKKNVADICDTLSLFLGKIENIYGINIQRVSTTDTLLVATKSIFTTYPSKENIYGLIYTLRTYIQQQDAKETSPPIMNVLQLDVDKYELMVAISTNKKLKEQGTIFFMRMVPGNFTSAIVKGGPGAVNNALNQIRLYMDDYKKTSMAISFQSLITDRMLEPDTSKWITRIFQPTF